MPANNAIETNLKLEETISRLRRLVELSVILNSTLNLKDLLALIISTAADILYCEAASILLYDEKKDALFFAAATGEDAAKLAKIPVPLDGSLAGTIFNTRQPLVHNHLENDPHHNKKPSSYVGFEAHSLLGVPLQIQDRIIGVLEAMNKKGGGFTESDQITLSVVASHAAVAIHNAQLMKALKDAYEDVSKADLLKSNFLALASHELRTPLGIIIGYTTFLQEESEGDNSVHAKQVLNAALQMRTILEDMNNLTLLETDTSSFKARKINLQDVFTKAVGKVAELAHLKEQKLVFKFPKDPLQITIDEKKFKSALVNILHNAIRFSPEKEEIIIGIKREKDHALCWVKDNGIGIPKGKLEDIFDKFYQVDSPNTRRYGGMGIGLTIAQGLIKKQGGKIWAESEGEGKGAIFKMSLPL